MLPCTVLSTSTPSYLRLLIQDREHGRNLRSTTMALCQPFTTTTFAKCAFRCSVPAVWNSLLKTVLSNVINVMSLWSLRWHFTNKSVTGAPYSIKGYSYSCTVTQLDTMVKSTMTETVPSWGHSGTAVTSVAVFKSRLKTFLFSQAFSSFSGH